MATEEHREPLSGAVSQTFMPAGAVFLSYASEDVATAERIATALRTAGIEVWFDKSELRGGDAWDRQIREQIQACALFLPIISANAHARVEGYFRFEWKLAVDRSHRMAPDQPFLVPVVIDDTRQSDTRIPDRFRELQWTRLPGGQVPQGFIERVQRLLSPTETDVSTVARPAGSSAPHSAKPPRVRAPASSRSQRAMLVAVAVVVFGSLAYFAIDKLWISKRSAGPERASLSTAQVASPAVAVIDKSIAVLPFVDLSEKHDQE